MELDNIEEEGYRVEHSANEITITLSSKRPNIILRFILGFFILISSLMALLMLIGSVTSGDFKIFHLVFIGLLAGSAYYLTRLLAWNLYGKEIITIAKETLTYVAHYKWFKDSKTTFSREVIEVNLLDRPVNIEGNYKLAFLEKDKSVHLVTEKQEETMKRIKEMILKFKDEQFLK